jgi:anti-sigma factor RsiW
MKITDDVIRDLLPLYLEGEVSADTRSLVEAYLAERPSLAAEARGAASFRLPRMTAGAAQDAERVVLRRTRHLLRLRFWTRFVAIFCTVMPFSFVFDSTGLHWLIWTGHASMAVTSLVLAAGAWIATAIVERRLKPGGF